MSENVARNTGHPPLWDALDTAAATGGRSRRHWQAGGVSIDSRSMARGDVFIALKTESGDGHDHVAAAMRKGAAAAIVDREPSDVDADSPLLIVDNTFHALERLGVFARNRSNARRVAITGSVGKTGTKNALAAALSSQGRTHASHASYNNQWGVPLTLARMRPETEFGVFEIGMNHAGEIRRLVPQIAPEIAVVTTIAPAHLAFFDSVEDIARAKAEIFEGVSRGGVAIIHGDIDQGPFLAKIAVQNGLRVITFGRGSECDCRLSNAMRDGNVTRVEAELDGSIYGYAVGPAGDHWVDNSLAILATVATLGLPVQDSLRALATLEAQPGRGGVETLACRSGSITLIDESYNANPRSMAAAIAVLGQHPGRKVAILGDMLELGHDAPAMHAALAAPIEAAGIDLVLTAGPLMAMLNAALPAATRGPYATGSEGLTARLADVLEPGDAVLVKGSLGSRMALIIEALRELPATSRQPERGASGDVPTGGIRGSAA